MGLIDIPQVLTQIIGFLLMVLILWKYGWGPVVRTLEARREKIAAEFRGAERVKAEAEQLKVAYDQKLRGADAEARRRIQEAVAEGQRVGAEIKAQAQAEATRRLERAKDEIAREAEKAKEEVKLQIVQPSMRTAEKILRQKLDDPAQRRLAGAFLDEVEALP